MFSYLIVAFHHLSLALDIIHQSLNTKVGALDKQRKTSHYIDET